LRDEIFKTRAGGGRICILLSLGEQSSDAVTNSRLSGDMAHA
jgi:hypothetical protein